MASLCDLAHSFMTNPKQDKMFILTLILSCTSKSRKFRSPKWRLNDNFSRQREKACRIGNHIGRNFEP